MGFFCLYPLKKNIPPPIFLGVPEFKGKVLWGYTPLRSINASYPLTLVAYCIYHNNIVKMKFSLTLKDSQNLLNEVESIGKTLDLVGVEYDLELSDDVVMINKCELRIFQRTENKSYKGSMSLTWLANSVNNFKLFASKCHALGWVLSESLDSMDSSVKVWTLKNKSQLMTKAVYDSLKSSINNTTSNETEQNKFSRSGLL